jgi:hypothetical protein
MNWTCLVYGGPMLGAMIWWVVSARKWFKGPKVNIEHHMLDRAENVINGKGELEGEASGGDSSGGSVRGKEDEKAATLA